MISQILSLLAHFTIYPEQHVIHILKLQVAYWKVLNKANFI